MAISVEEARAMTEEQLQETITEMAFEIIANVGTARGMYIEAIQEAKAGNFDQAAQLLKDGKEAFVLGHHGHADLLEWQGQGLTWKSNIYLLHAEALARTGDLNGAVVELNKIHTRAGLPAYLVGDFIAPDDVVRAVLDERTIELIGEGKFWFDLLRTDHAADICGITDPNKYLFPINKTHLDENYKLKQNPGYGAGE